MPSQLKDALLDNREPVNEQDDEDLGEVLLDDEDDEDLEEVPRTLLNGGRHG